MASAHQMRMIALLDVTLLVALLDGAHLQHARSRAWLEANIGAGWASCPLTQNGCIRILSQPGYPGARPPALIALRLAEATATTWHRFWPDDLSLLDTGILDWSQVLGDRQTTDVYLLALAVRHGGCFVTFDRGIPLAAVAGASAQHLVLL